MSWCNPVVRSVCLALGLAIGTGAAMGQQSTPAGKDVPQIVGGQNALIQDYPWQVALLNASYNQVCGGSIIAPRWILTAAHCSGGLKYIRAGVTDKTAATGQTIAIRREILNPSYEVPTAYNNDIMLLELEADLDLSGDKAKAIPIMTVAAAATGLQNPGVNATITGWGNTSQGGTDSIILQKAVVPIALNSAVVGPYLALPPPDGPMYVTDKMIPAGFAAGGIDSCQGDSGGPLAVPDPASAIKYRLAGVTSFGHGCALPTYLGIYTRVSEFEAWIIASMVPSPSGPEVTGITPASGSAAGGTQVVIAGTSFLPASAVNSTAADSVNAAVAYPTVSIGGTACQVTSASDTQVACTTGAHAPGVVNVSVTTAYGSGTLSNAFTYLAPGPVPLPSQPVPTLNEWVLLLMTLLLGLSGSWYGLRRSGRR